MSKGEHDSGMRILLFEDTEDTRQRIVNDFTTQLRSNVTECAKAGQVLDLLKQQSTAFDFVVIDYKMEYAEGNIRTGLDLVERIVKSQELQILIPIILYTLREDTPSVVYRRSRHLGVQYVHQLELTGLLNDLKKRLQVLKAIKTRLEKMLAQKRLMGHVLGELDVGFQIVDLDCKIHYQDDKYKRLMGESGSKGNVCFCTVHGYPLAHDRCFNCLMRKGVPETKKSPETVAHGYEESTYYSPIYPDGPGSRPVYEYIEVRTFPVCVGGACKSGAKPDAVIETVRIVPAGTCIASKPRCDHLDILRRAFLDFGYREARIYEYIEGDKTLVPACVGDDNRVAIALQSTPDVVDGAREDLLSFEISDVSCLKTPRLVLDSGIQQFLIGLRDARGRFVGVVALGHDRKEKDDYAWIDRDRWREEDRDSSNAASVKQKDGKGESAETVKVIGPSSLSIQVRCLESFAARRPLRKQTSLLQATRRLTYCIGYMAD
jgi:CheY-like chemotaxis protein